MAKFTKIQRSRIITALLEVERAQAFILRDDVRVCITKRMATTTIDYSNLAGDPVLVAISKKAGSNLTGLYNAVKILRRILEENDK